MGFRVQLPEPERTWSEVRNDLQKWYIFMVEQGDSQRKPSKGTKLSNEDEKFNEFLDQVKQAHRIFLGRVRWTSLFAEELLRRSLAPGGQLTRQQVQDASQRTAEGIKFSLKERIRNFKDARWVEELFWTAIQSDVYSMSRMFSDQASMDLITNGFARLSSVNERDGMQNENERDGTQNEEVFQGHFDEPLALKAVMEYLRDSKNGDLYEKLMNRFFASLQVDRGQAGAVGKLAEFVFTAVSSSTSHPKIVHESVF